MYNERKDEGFDIMVVIGEDTAGNPPTLEYCKKYAKDKGISPEQTFIDHNGAAWGTMFSYVNNYSSGSFGIPWNVIFDGRSMEYAYSDTASGSEGRDQTRDRLLDEFNAIPTE